MEKQSFHLHWNIFDLSQEIADKFPRNAPYLLSKTIRMSSSNVAPCKLQHQAASFYIYSHTLSALYMFSPSADSYISPIADVVWDCNIINVCKYKFIIIYNFILEYHTNTG